MTIVLVCNKCSCDDLKRGDYGLFRCPTCGSDKDWFEVHPMELIPIVRRGDTTNEEEAKARMANTPNQ